MKKAAIAGIFLISLISQSLTAQNSIDWLAVRKAYFDKYHPTDTPVWIFPLVFEEGNGGRDTIYMGYHSEASVILNSGGDVRFGEKQVAVDSSKFNAGWGFATGSDSLLKNNLTNFGVPASSSISFRNGILPLTVWWDREAFYSDSLPFAAQSPAPRAEGLLGFNYPSVPETQNNCDPHWPILMSDSIKLDWYCGFSDSIVFVHYTGGSGPPSILNLYIRPWEGNWVGTEEMPATSPIKIFPNPSSDYLFVQTGEEAFDITIVNLQGQSIFQKDMPKNATEKIVTQDWPAGTYILKAISQKRQASSKIIINP